MNETGFKNYILNEAFDDEVIDLAKAYGEANYYDDFVLYSSLNSIVEAAGWDAEQLAWQLEDVDTNADYFRFDGRGNLESIDSDELVDEIKHSYLNELCQWVSGASGYYYQNFSDEVREFIDQCDPFDLINGIEMSYEDLGIVGDVKKRSPEHHEYAVTLSSKIGEDTFSYFCNPNKGFLPTRADMINAVLADHYMFEDYLDLGSFAEANGLDINDPDERSEAEELTDTVEANYEKLLNVIDEDDIEVVGLFLSDVDQGRYPNISWDDLNGHDDLDKENKDSSLDTRADEAKEACSEMKQNMPERNVDIDAR